MIGVYFSGTGNTKHCVERLVRGLDSEARLFSLEEKEAVQAIQSEETVIFGYPVYYSDLPKIVRDFIEDNSQIWRGKKILIVATMGAFSGDGAGCSARLFKKYGAVVSGGLHLKMPDCIGDVKLLKKPLEKNREIIRETDKKIDGAVEKIRCGHYPKEGLNFFYHVAGLFGQRLYFPNKTKRYYKKIKADSKKCIGCGLCAKACPMQNISVHESGIAFHDKCTMCYRCFVNCPRQAITIIGKKVFEQSKFEDYGKP